MEDEVSRIFWLPLDIKLCNLPHPGSPLDVTLENQASHVSLYRR